MKRDVFWRYKVTYRPDKTFTIVNDGDELDALIKRVLKEGAWLSQITVEVLP